MAGRSSEERIDRLEQVVQVIAEDQLSLQKLIAELATETRRGFDRVAQQFEETDRRMRQTDERMRQTDDRMRQTDERTRQTDERMRQTDERIGKLVIAIGELIRHPSVPPA
jgi:methyl-accepting chemotaxis protein